jgi:hypothetical protein
MRAQINDIDYVLLHYADLEKLLGVEKGGLWRKLILRRIKVFCGNTHALMRDEFMRDRYPLRHNHAPRNSSSKLPRRT